MAQLKPRFEARRGTLEWYCVDHWSEELEFDIAALKHELRAEIRYLPGATDFLDRVRARGKRLLLTTNAHPISLAVKNGQTGLDQHFDELVSSHEFGAPKESPEFWRRLERTHGVAPRSTLFVDDSATVIAAARTAGVACIYQVLQPDSTLPPHAARRRVRRRAAARRPARLSRGPHACGGAPSPPPAGAPPAPPLPLRPRPPRRRRRLGAPSAVTAPTWPSPAGRAAALACGAGAEEAACSLDAGCGRDGPPCLVPLRPPPPPPWRGEGRRDRRRRARDRRGHRRRIRRAHRPGRCRSGDARGAARHFRQQFLRDGRHRDLAADVVLDVGQRHHEILAAEADRVAFRAGARGAADAVDVVLGVLRQVVVEDVGDVRDVQAARGDVRADQDREFAAVEVGDHPQALLLRHVARDRLGVEAVGLAAAAPAPRRRAGCSRTPWCACSPSSAAGRPAASASRPSTGSR